MTEENSDGNGESNVSLSVPIGAIAAAAVLGLAAAAYALLNRQAETDESGASPKTKSSNIKRRFGLMTLATLIENDTTRKLLVSVIRAIARRS